MMTDEEKAATRAGLHAKANGNDPSKPADAAPSEPGYLMQAGRGLARGLASDIPGASTSSFATQDDAGPVEQGARYVGEYGPLFVPGLDFGLGAKFGTKAAEWALQHGPSIQTLAKAVGPEAARRMIHGMWDTLPSLGSHAAKGAIGGVAMDPEHPLEGAATGAGTAIAGGAARKAFGTLPQPIQHAAGGVVGGAGTVAGLEGARMMQGGRRGEDWPMYLTLRHALSPLLAIAAAAARLPTAAGGAGAATRNWMDDNGEK